MGKGFGIASLVLAILAIFVPLYGFVISAIAILLAIAAVFGGDRIFATAVSLICFVNALFLSPSFWIFVVANSHQNPQAITYTVIGYCLLPFAAMVGIAFYQRRGPAGAPIFSDFDQWGRAAGVSFASSTSFTQGSANSAAAGKPSNDPQKPYDERKWMALIRFDEEIRAAATTVRAYGQRWEDELARTYLQINDKGSLDQIVRNILGRAQR